MMSRKDETKKGVMEKLIAIEEESALAEFRASGFEAKVRTKVRQLSGREGRHSLRQAAPAAAWISLASVILIGVVLFLILPHKTPGPNMAQMIADVLRQTPRIQTIEENAIAEAPRQNRITSPLETGILAVIFGGIRSPNTDQASGRSSPPASIKSKSQPLSLEETYKILFIDKAVERFLALRSS